MEIDKEIDDRGKEILSRIGKESLRTTFLLATSLIQRSQQSRCRLRSGGKVRYILPLDRIDAV